MTITAKRGSVGNAYETAFNAKSLSDVPGLPGTEDLNTERREKTRRT